MKTAAPTSLLRWTNRLLWWALASVIVLLALYVSAGRYAMSLLAQHQQKVLGYLNARLPVQLEVQQLRGDWQDFTPSLLLSGVQVRGSAAGSHSPLQINGVRVGIDVWNSLRWRSLQLSQLELDQLSVQLLYLADGSLQIPGLEMSGGGSLSAFWNFVMATRLIRIHDGRVQLSTERAGTLPLQLDLALERSGDFRRLQAFTVLEGHADQLELIAELRGDPLRIDVLRSDAYLRAQIADVSRYQPLLPQSETQSAAGRLQFETHFGWDGAQAAISGSIQADELRWHGDDKRALDLSAAAMSVQGEWRGSAWQLDLADVHIEQSERQGSLSRAQLSRTTEGLAIRLQDGDIGPFADVLATAGLVPDTAATALTQLQPQGQIPAAEFHWLAHKDTPDWKLRSRFRDLAVQSWNNAPGVSGADGYLELVPGGGRVFLESERLSLALPKVFSTDLAYEYVAGVLDLNWAGDGFGLQSGILRTRGAEGQAVGLLRLSIPRPNTERVPEMELLLGLTSSTPQHRYKYLPFALPQQLLGWLDGAFDEGRIRSGGFLWRGSLRPGDAPLRTVQLFFDVEQLVLSYHPDWPALRDASGLAFVNDAQVSVWLHQGRLYDATVRDVSAELNASPGALELSIAGEMALGGADLSRLLRETPLRTRLPALADWEMSGQADGRLELAMDLTDVRGSLNIAARTQWRDAGISMPALPLELTELSGELAYSTASGLSASDLQGALWGEPVQAVIVTTAAETEEPSTRIAVTGSVVPQRALAHFQLPLEDRLLGTTAFNAELTLSDSRSALTINSDLDGIRVDLPVPWGKTAAERQPLALTIPLSRGDDWRLELEHLVDLRWNPVRRVAALGLGGSPLALPAEGLLVSGGLSSLDVPATVALLNELSMRAEPRPQTSVEAWPVSVDALVIDQLLVGDADLGGVVLDLEREDAWRAGVYADWFRLEAQMDQDLRRGELRFDDLDLAEWDRRKAKPAEEGATADDASQELPQDRIEWPALAVDIVQLRRDQEVLGSLQFGYRRSQDQHRVDQLRGEYRGLRFSAAQPSELIWQGRGQAAQTALKAAMEFDDVGQVLHRFAYMPIVDSRSGQLEIDLRWPGGPTAFTLPSANGDVRLSMREGSFQTAPPAAAGALRVVGILNLAEMVVRLDPSRPFQSGIPFDRMEAELSLGDGRLELAALDVRGPGSRFQVAGVADLLERTQTGELIATLPVSNNLPWVAALAGGLPAAAGLFVFSRVFEKQIQQAASLRYRIGGSWDEPEVQLDALFAKPSAPTVSRAEGAEVKAPDKDE